jgi:hypothetical protein
LREALREAFREDSREDFREDVRADDFVRDRFAVFRGLFAMAIPVCR